MRFRLDGYWNKARGRGRVAITEQGFDGTIIHLGTGVGYYYEDNPTAMNALEKGIEQYWILKNAEPTYEYLMTFAYYENVDIGQIIIARADGFNYSGGTMRMTNYTAIYYQNGSYYTTYTGGVASIAGIPFQSSSKINGTIIENYEPFKE